jgi:hypothetical protein
MVDDLKTRLQLPTTREDLLKKILKNMLNKLSNSIVRNYPNKYNYEKRT